MARVNETINPYQAVNVGNTYDERTQPVAYAEPMARAGVVAQQAKHTLYRGGSLYERSLANAYSSMHPMPIPMPMPTENSTLLPQRYADSNLAASSYAINAMSASNTLTAQQAFLLQSEAQALSVNDFVHRLNDVFKSMGDVFVKGEVSSCRDQQHLYFTIKDEKASINCVMYRRNRDAIGFVPKVGQTVLVLATNSLYAKSGSFSLLVKNMVLAGNGMLMEMLRLREQKLEQEGLFARKRDLPRIIGSVAVVTSLDGRARYDLTMNALRRNPFVQLTFFETKVQGQDAVDSIVETLNHVYRLINLHHAQIDVIVLTRGGGSFEDLLCFSEEEVVRAVARSPVPIISAIGHDEDCPICDRAADLRVSTPTAAAEAITTITRQSMLHYLYEAVDRADNAIFSRIDQYQFGCMNLLERCKSNRNISFMLDSLQARMDAVQTMLEVALHKQLDPRQNKFAESDNRLKHHGLLERLRGYGYRLQQQQKVLDTISYRLSDTERRLTYCVNRLRSNQICSGQVERSDFKLSNLQQRLNSAIERYLNDAQQRMHACEIGLDFLPERSATGQLTVRELPRSFELMTKHAQARLRSLDQSLLQLNPLYQLERGLSLTTVDGVHSVKAAELKQGSEIITLMQGAKVYSTVTKTEKWDMVSLDEIKLNAELEAEREVMLERRAAASGETWYRTKQATAVGPDESESAIESESAVESKSEAAVEPETAVEPERTIEPESAVEPEPQPLPDTPALQASSPASEAGAADPVESAESAESTAPADAAHDFHDDGSADASEPKMDFALEPEDEIEKPAKTKRTRAKSAKKATTDADDQEATAKPKARARAKAKSKAQKEQADQAAQKKQDE